MSSPIDAKPQYGGGEEEGEYDLPLHVAALCKKDDRHREGYMLISVQSWFSEHRYLVWRDDDVRRHGLTSLGAGFPVVAKKAKWLRIPPRVFFACKHFG